jgi:hypothetical protein
VAAKDRIYLTAIDGSTGVLTAALPPRSWRRIASTTLSAPHPPSLARTSFFEETDPFTVSVKRTPPNSREL